MPWRPLDPAADEAHEAKDDGHDEQDVEQSSQRGFRDDAEKPQDHQHQDKKSIVSLRRGLECTRSANLAGGERNSWAVRRQSCLRSGERAKGASAKRKSAKGRCYSTRHEVAQNSADRGAARHSWLPSRSSSPLQSQHGRGRNDRRDRVDDVERRRCPPGRSPRSTRSRESYDATTGANGGLHDQSAEGNLSSRVAAARG